MLTDANLFKRLRVLCRARRSGYHFPLSDYWLYLRHAEYPGSARHFPAVRVTAQDNRYVQLQICARRYYWPSEAHRKGLEWIHQEVFMPASHNFHAYEFAGVRINPGDHVIDAGAFVGFFVHYALQRGATVLALEPVPSLAEAMARTFAEEIAEERVRVLPAALGAAKGRANLDIVPDRIYESRIGSSGTEVEVVSLDDIGVSERVDFIKMDIEGAEVDAIRGGSRTIATQKPRLAIAVYHEEGNARQICELLRQIRPDYKIRCRGIFAWDGCEPRPFMVYAW